MRVRPVCSDGQRATARGGPAIAGRKLRGRLSIAVGIILLAQAIPVFAQSRSEAGAPSMDSGGVRSSLPDAPEKALVLRYCNVCHDIAWIERSGGSERGWTERIRRMNRAGAAVPREQIPALAGYLARALPERPRPPPTGKSIDER